jgi:geranylgeranyl reductase family protein
LDVVIVGSGPAGSLCAYTLSRWGYKVALIEKSEHPRHKPCGGGVSRAALSLLPFKVPKALIEGQVKGFRIVDPGFNLHEFASAEAAGIMVVRKYFDEFLAKKAADAGARLTQNTYVKGISDPSGGRRFIRLSNGAITSARFIVGADGANSSVARLTGIRTKWGSEELGIAQHCFAEVEGQSVSAFMGGSDGILELHFSELPMGYGWVFPLKDRVNVGIGGRAKEMVSQGRRGIKHLDAFVKRVERSRNGEFKLKPGATLAHLIPAGGFPKREVGRGNVLLAGDAGGFVDPLSGEGLRYAFLSARLAARAISMADKNRTCAMNYYRGFCDEAITRNLSTALKYAHLVHNHLPFAFKALRYFPGRASAFKELARGATYREIKFGALRRLPRSLLGWALGYLSSAGGKGRTSQGLREALGDAP